jgi:transposase
MASGSEQNEGEVAAAADRLRVENERLTDEVDLLAGENLELRSEIDSFARKIAALEKRLGKNSENSSLPPSLDLFGRAKHRPENANRAARRALGRKPGKQPGTDGKHLAHVDDPDEVQLHTPSACDGCGADLADVPVERTEIRQVTDVPTPVPITTEYRAESKRCAFGTVTKAALPAEARGHASYGPRIRATAYYLLCRQHLPFERTKEAMADLLGVTVSTGFLDSVYSEGSDELAGFLTAVLAQLRDTDVVYMDETSDRLGKGSVWFHVVCTELLTLLHADRTRGPDGIEATGLLPDFSGVAVHDRLGVVLRLRTADPCGMRGPSPEQPGLGRSLLRPDPVDFADEVDEHFKSEPPRDSWTLWGSGSGSKIDSGGAQLRDALGSQSDDADEWHDDHAAKLFTVEPAAADLHQHSCVCTRATPANTTHINTESAMTVPTFIHLRGVRGTSVLGSSSHDWTVLFRL